MRGLVGLYVLARRVSGRGRRRVSGPIVVLQSKRTAAIMDNIRVEFEAVLKL